MRYIESIENVYERGWVCLLQRKLVSLVDKFEAENEGIRQSLQNSNMSTTEAAEPEVTEQENSNLSITRPIQGVHPDLVNDSDEDDDNFTHLPKNEIDQVTNDSAKTPDLHGMED